MYDAAQMDHNSPNWEGDDNILQNCSWT